MAKNKVLWEMKKKYFTEEERKAAKREARKRYRKAHPEKVRESKKTLSPRES